jgi:hypothetical protein
MEAFIRRYHSRVRPFCDIIEGHMIHALSWTEGHHDNREIWMVRCGVYRSLSELLEVTHDLNDHHRPVLVDHILRELEHKGESDGTELLEALKCLDVLLENVGLLLSENLMIRVAEALTGVVAKEPVVSDVVMETTTNCLSNLLQVGVPIAIGLILEHLNAKNVKCHQRLSRTLVLTSTPRQVSPGGILRSGVSQNDGLETDGRVLHNPLSTLSNLGQVLHNSHTQKSSTIVSSSSNQSERAVLHNPISELSNPDQILHNGHKQVNCKTSTITNPEVASHSQTGNMDTTTEAVKEQPRLCNTSQLLHNEDIDEPFGTQDMPILVDSSPDRMVD